MSKTIPTHCMKTEMLCLLYEITHSHLPAEFSSLRFTSASEGQQVFCGFTVQLPPTVSSSWTRLQPSTDSNYPSSGFQSWHGLKCAVSWLCDQTPLQTHKTNLVKLHINLWSFMFLARAVKYCIRVKKISLEDLCVALLWKWNLSPEAACQARTDDWITDETLGAFNELLRFWD